jgi:tetratricopeptide (TPR) repeat protein
MNQGRHALAEKELGRILAEDPEDNTAHEYMAWCMADQGRPREAMNRANNAIRLAPDEAQPYFVKATCYTKNREYKKSLTWFRQALRLNPYVHFYYSSFAGAFHSLERYPEALRTAKKGLRQNPQSVECHNARTKALTAMGEDDEALASAEKTLALDPENAKALHLKGKLLMGKRKYKEAQAAIRESLRIQPRNGKAVSDLKLIRIFNVIRWPLLFGGISFLSYFFTGNVASVAAAVAFGFFANFCLTFLDAEGSKLQRAMMVVAPFLIMLGALSVVFFSQADPWYHDWAAWVFAILFCVICVNSEGEYFNEERGFALKAWAEMVGPTILIVSLFFLNPAGVMLGLNGGLLITRFNWLNKTRPGRWFRFHRFLRFLSVPFIVWVAGSTYWDWQACTAWYGNGDVWGDEAAYFILLVWLESGTPDEEPSKEEKESQAVSTKPLLGGNHE